MFTNLPNKKLLGFLLHSNNVTKKTKSQCFFILMYLNNQITFIYL